MIERGARVRLSSGRLIVCSEEEEEEKKLPSASSIEHVGKSFIICAKYASLSNLDSYSFGIITVSQGAAAPRVQLGHRQLGLGLRDVCGEVARRRALRDRARRVGDKVASCERERERETGERKLKRECPRFHKVEGMEESPDRLSQRMWTRVGLAVCRERGAGVVDHVQRNALPPQQSHETFAAGASGDAQRHRERVEALREKEIRQSFCSFFIKRRQPKGTVVLEHAADLPPLDRMTRFAEI